MTTTAAPRATARPAPRTADAARGAAGGAAGASARARGRQSRAKRAGRGSTRAERTTMTTVPRRRITLLMLAGALALFAGAFLTCQGARGVKRKTGPRYAEESASWLRAVRTLGGAGMWLVVRGYHPGDDAIAMATDSPRAH